MSSSNGGIFVVTNSLLNAILENLSQYNCLFY